MFGITAFAQAPFAALGGNAYVFSLTEDSGLADSNSQTFTFLQSITEPFTITDNNSQAGLFIETISEGFTLADSNTLRQSF